MNARQYALPKAGRALGCLFALTVAAIATPGAAGTDELPSFQPGMWSFVISIASPGATAPHMQSLRKCTNPSEDIRKKWQMLALETCKFSPVTHNGNRYSYTSSCQKEGMQLSTKAVITVEGDQAYRVDTESRTNSQVRKETLVAKREGDCAKPDGHMPIPQPRKDPEKTATP